MLQARKSEDATWARTEKKQAENDDDVNSQDTERECGDKGMQLYIERGLVVLLIVGVDAWME